MEVNADSGDAGEFPRPSHATPPHASTQNTFLRIGPPRYVILGKKTPLIAKNTEALQNLYWSPRAFRMLWRSFLIKQETAGNSQIWCSANE